MTLGGKWSYRPGQGHGSLRSKEGADRGISLAARGEALSKLRRCFVTDHIDSHVCLCRCSLSHEGDGAPAQGHDELESSGDEVKADQVPRPARGPAFTQSYEMSSPSPLSDSAADVSEESVSPSRLASTSRDFVDGLELCHDMPIITIIS